MSNKAKSSVHTRRAQLEAELAALDLNGAHWDEYEENEDDSLIDRACVYLGKLRKSGEVNMYGAGASLQNRYGIARKEAQEILKFWMEHFSELEQGMTTEEAWKTHLANGLADGDRKERVKAIKRAGQSRPV